MIRLFKTLQIALGLTCVASAGPSFAKYDVEVIRISKELRGRIYSERKYSDPEDVELKRVVVICPIPCDHVPIRSWPLFRAKDLMRGVIESFQREQSQ